MAQPDRPTSYIPAGLVRMSAFLRKEMVETVRQPRLILMLVLSPFLIMLIFGLGFRNEPRALRTVFVVDPAANLNQQVEQFASTLGPQLLFVGLMDDADAARQRLWNGEVDLVVVVPGNAYQQVINNQRAVFELYHQEIDPFQANYVDIFGQVYIDEVNRRVLRRFVDQGQEDLFAIQTWIGNARNDAAALREALAQGNQSSADERLANLEQSIASVQTAVGLSIGVLLVLQPALEVDGVTSRDVLALMSDISRGIRSLNMLRSQFREQMGSLEQISAEVGRLELNLNLLEGQLATIRAIDSRVMVSPFEGQVDNVAPAQPLLADFFAPAVIVLLLQHLTVTFAALSLVRERRLGTVELFRVSPLSPLEILMGKYISYLLFGGVLALVLTVLMVFGLSVPMLGPWMAYGVSIGALIFTSLGVGFIISLLARTDIQAVQYAMIMLLVSVFFSGFLISLESLRDPVLVLAWSLPATYGIALLRNIMLRGDIINPLLTVYLLLIGGGLFGIAWAMLRRMLRNIS